MQHPTFLDTSWLICLWPFTMLFDGIDLAYPVHNCVQSFFWSMYSFAPQHALVLDACLNLFVCPHTHNTMTWWIVLPCAARSYDRVACQQREGKNCNLQLNPHVQWVLLNWYPGYILFQIFQDISRKRWFQARSNTKCLGTFQGKSFVHSMHPAKKFGCAKRLCGTELLAASCSWHSIPAHQAFVSCKPEAACSNCNTEAHA